MCICVKNSEGTMNQLNKYGLGHYIDDSMYEVTLRQSELNSLNLGWLHFKQPGLTKTNPYICVDIFVLDEFTIAFQQLYTDSIAVKIIGNKELIEEIELTKRYEEKVSWKDELDSIRKYQVEFNMNRLQDYEDKTSIDDYDIKWEVNDSWRNILQAKREIAEEQRIENRIAFLEEKRQEKLDELTLQEVKNCRTGQKKSPEFYNFIATQSGSDVYKNIRYISKKYNKSFKAIWRAWKFMYGVHELEELNNK